MAIIDKPIDYFNSKIYTGNSSSQTLSMANIGLAWFKSRSDSGGHLLIDIMRGGNGTNSQEPILKADQSGKDQGSDITAAGGLVFGSSSTSVGTDNGGYNYNQNGKSYVNWHWQAGTSFSNSAGANGASIASTGNFNNTSGFSTVLYTGTGTAGTIKHGMNTAPAMIIAKRTNASEDWAVYHQSLGASKYINLNTTNALDSSTSRWNGVEPTSSVFSVNTHAAINASSSIYIAYCFAEKPSYSKMSTYIGNGNVNGPFVFCGFKPSFIIGKRTDSSGGWWIVDSKRPGFNLTDEYLTPNNSDAERDDGSFSYDFLANGFKCRYNNSNYNGSGGTYLYMAFAENPFVTSTDNDSIPTTAR